jgi:hypothetical protein
MFSLDFHCKENDGIIEFGEQPEVTGSHIRRVRSLTNHRSLVFSQKKSESSAKNVLKHYRDGGVNCPLTTSPVSCTTQHHIDVTEYPCSTFLAKNKVGYFSNR